MESLRKRRQVFSGATTVSTVRLGGFRTRVLTVAGRGPGIVLLHGFSDTADTWRAVLEPLAERGVRAAAVDLPGFGAADPLRPGPVLPQLDAFVADAIRRWTVVDRAPILVGNSLGGLLAARAAAGSDPPSGVVLVSPAGYAHSRWIDALGWASRIPARWLPPPLPMAAYRRLVWLGARHLGGGGAPLIDGEAARFSTQFRARRDVAHVFVSAALLLAELDDYETASIPVPALVLWGERDRLTKVAGATQIAPLLTRGSVQVIANAGHCPQLQVPDLIASSIASFLEEYGFVG